MTVMIKIPVQEESSSSSYDLVILGKKHTNYEQNVAIRIIKSLRNIQCDDLGGLQQKNCILRTIVVVLIKH